MNLHALALLLLLLRVTRQNSAVLASEPSGGATISQDKLKNIQKLNLPYFNYVLPKVQEIVTQACGIKLGNVVSLSYTVRQEVLYDFVTETQYGDLFAEASVQFTKGILQINKIDFVNSSSIGEKMPSDPSSFNGSKNSTTVQIPLKFVLPLDPNVTASLQSNLTAKEGVKATNVSVDKNNTALAPENKIQKMQTSWLFGLLKDKCTGMRRGKGKLGSQPILGISPVNSTQPPTTIKQVAQSQNPIAGALGAQISLIRVQPASNPSQNGTQTGKNNMTSNISEITVKNQSVNISNVTNVTTDISLIAPIAMPANETSANVTPTPNSTVSSPTLSQSNLNLTPASPAAPTPTAAPNLRVNSPV